jgi:AcrR family transcriptional regulator
MLRAKTIASLVVLCFGESWISLKRKIMLDKKEPNQLEKQNMNQSSGLQLPPTARGQKTRQRILEAAEVTFGEKSYDVASISDITKTADVGQGTFYLYFPDKKSVFVELVRNLSKMLRKRLAEATAGLTDRLEIERVGLRAFCTFIRSHKHLYRIVRQAEFVEPTLYRWYYDRMAAGYIKGLSQAMEAGQIRQLNPESTAYCLMAIGDFIGMRWVLWEDKEVPDEILETAMAFIQHGLAPK